MKRELYWWLLQLAYNMVLHHDRKFKKWCKKHEEWRCKYAAEYSTGGGVQ